MKDTLRKTLLVVDDEEINCAILSNIFAPEYEILTASDGLEALDLIETHRNRLSAVLLDVIMPRLNGIQVLRTLRQQGLLNTIPVFLITADSDGTTMREAYDLGVMALHRPPAG